MTRNDALLAARSYIREGIDSYEYERFKADAWTHLFLGDWAAAVYCTRVALFISRLLRVSR